MSVKEIKTYIDDKGELTGCGFLGYTITLNDCKTKLDNTNAKLRGLKRKAEEHILDFPTFKKRRISEPGNKQK